MKIGDIPQPNALLEGDPPVASKSTQNLLFDVRQACLTLWQSGTTAQRPPNPVLGQIYDDLTLGSLVYCTTVATGPHTSDAVWTPIGGGGAFIQADYVVFPIDNAGLTNSRVLTAGTGITITDGGAKGPVIIAASGGGATPVLGMVLTFGR